MSLQLYVFRYEGLIETCPLCDTKGLSQIPLALDEVCAIEYDNSRGITLI